MGVEDSDWARQRSQAIAAHAADAARREAVEADQAGAMLTDFVRTARARGIRPVPLLARSYDARHRYRTGLRGWYLKTDESVAVGENGEFYVLSVRGSATARLTGVTIAPARARLVIGEGGRDGDRMTLRALLDRILAD